MAEQTKTRADVATMLREFHDTFGGPGTKTDDLRLRPTLHEEEHAELIEALGWLEDQRDGNHQPQETWEGALKAVARELADVVYIAYGTALIAGIDLDTAVSEVHRANMSKLSEDGRPILREDGKVLKGPNFRPPDMALALDPTPTTPHESGEEEVK